MAEIAKETFMQAKGEALLNSYVRSDKMLSFLRAVILLVNAIFIYLVTYTANTSAVLLFLVGATVINLFLYLNIGASLQSYNILLDKVIFFESQIAPYRLFHCKQKLEEEFGATDIRIHAKNIAFAMMILYALGAVLFANYHGYSILSLFWLV